MAHQVPNYRRRSYRGVFAAFAACALLCLLTNFLTACTPAEHPLLRPYVIALYVGQSRTYAAEFDNTAALEAANRALSLDPANPLLLVERGDRHLLAYQWDAARADYEAALALDPTRAETHYALGLLFASAPEGVDARREALAAFQQATALGLPAPQAENARRYIVQLEAQLRALSEHP